MMNKLGKNWAWKIGCLVAAIVLWFVVIYEQNPTSEASYTVPVAVKNLDARFIAADLPKTVYVRISGPRNTIVNMGDNEIKAYIDLSEVEEGEQTVPIHVDIPQGTELKKQNAKTATIRVDWYAVQEITLTPCLVGKLNDGISVSSVKLVPEKVIVSGARRLIRQVDSAIIEIPMGGKDKDFTFMAPIKLFQSDGTPVEGLQITPRQTNVSVSIAQNAVAKKVPVNLITYGTPADDMKLKQVVITPKEIEVRGTAEAINEINGINLPAISIDGLDKNREWRVNVPAVQGVVAIPDSVKVLVEIE